MPTQPTRSQSWRLLDIAGGAAIGILVLLFLQSAWASAHPASAPPRLPGWYSGPLPNCQLTKLDNYGAESATPSAFGYYLIEADWQCASKVPQPTPTPTARP